MKSFQEFVTESIDPQALLNQAYELGKSFRRYFKQKYGREYAPVNGTSYGARDITVNIKFATPQHDDRFCELATKSNTPNTLVPQLWQAWENGIFNKPSLEVDDWKNIDGSIHNLKKSNIDFGLECSIPELAPFMSKPNPLTNHQGSITDEMIKKYLRV